MRLIPYKDEINSLLQLCGALALESEDPASDSRFCRRLEYVLVKSVGSESLHVRDIVLPAPCVVTMGCRDRLFLYPSYPCLNWGVAVGSTSLLMYLLLFM